jgi:hypothetical protein
MQKVKAEEYNTPSGLVRAVPMVEIMSKVQESHVSKNSKVETNTYNGSFFPR